MKMNLISLTLLSLLFYSLTCFSGCAPASRIQNNISAVLIQNINVIDVEKGIVLYSQDVLLEGQHIAFVGEEFQVPENFKGTFIDGKGKYLMPGLWDMHFHLSWLNGNDSLLYPVLLQNGITGIRDMGGDLLIAELSSFPIQLNIWLSFSEACKAF